MGIHNKQQIVFLFTCHLQFRLASRTRTMLSQLSYRTGKLQTYDFNSGYQILSNHNLNITNSHCPLYYQKLYIIWHLVCNQKINISIRQQPNITVLGHQINFIFRDRNYYNNQILMQPNTFDQLINGILQFIIQQKINGIKNNTKQQLVTLTKWDIQKDSPSNASLASIFQKLNGKKPENKNIPSNFIQMNFKLITNQNNNVLASEMWELQWKDTISNEKKISPNQFLALIKGMLWDIIQVSLLIPNWRDFINNKHQKVSNCYITYQITHARPLRMNTMGLNKAQLCSSFHGKNIQCTVYHITNKSIDDTSNMNMTSSLMVLRKESISTMVTSEEQELSSSPRKVSIYSYYDAENDVTFLSNDEFSLEGEETEIQNITYQKTDFQEEEEYEMILIDEDHKLLQFKSGLKQLQNTLPNSVLYTNENLY